MTAALVAALLALPPSPPPGNPDPFRGSEEAPKLNQSSSGFTLDKLQGMPMTRPVYSPPQSWYYQPNIWLYPANSPGLGGYVPPGSGGNYRLGMYWWVR